VEPAAGGLPDPWAPINGYADMALSRPARYASIIKRSLAFFADLLFLSAFVWLMAGISMNIDGFRSGILSMSHPGKIFGYLLFYQHVLAAIYFTLGVGLFGGTFGKRLVGVYVAREDGSEVSIPRAFGRFLAYYPSALIFGLGFLWALADPKAQAWHDKIAGTVVLEIE